MKSKERTEINKSLKLLAKSSIFVFIAIFISKVLTYIYRIVVARQFGAEVYGLFALSLMVIGWFKIFSDLGLRNGLIRYIPLYKGKRKNNEIRYILNKTLKILLITSVISSAIIFFTADYISLNIFKNQELIIFLKIFSLVLPFSILSGHYLSILIAYEKIYWFTFIEKILFSIVNLLAVSLLVFLGINSVSVPLSYLFATITMFILAFFICFKSIKIDKVSSVLLPKKNIFKEVFEYSWPLVFFGLIFSLFSWADSLIIGIFRSVEEVGIYNAAVPIALLITVSKDLFVSLFFPLVNKEYGKNNLETVKQLSKQIGKWIFIISLPLTILILLFPKQFIDLLFGSEFNSASNALRFLAVGALFTSIFEVSRDLISVKGKSKVILYSVIIALILNLILNLIFVPKYGMTGAGFATMLSLIFLNLFFAYQSFRFMKVIPLKRKIIRIFFISLIPTAIIYAITRFITVDLIWFFSLVIFYLLLYIILILATKCLDENDLTVLNTIKSKLF